MRLAGPLDGLARTLVYKTVQLLQDNPFSVQGKRFLLLDSSTHTIQKRAELLCDGQEVNGAFHYYHFLKIPGWICHHKRTLKVGICGQKVRATSTFQEFSRVEFRPSYLWLRANSAK